MDKEASGIKGVISRLRDRADILEIVKMAKVEVVHGLASRDLGRYDRGVAIYEAASEALGNANVRGQLPRYVQAA